MKYVLIGKIVNTHGLKGELRIISDFKYKKYVFKKDMKIYIGKNKTCEVINSYRYHKIYDMITLVGYNNIDEVLKYKGEYVFINKEDLTLGKNEYLDEDLIGLKVYVDEELKGTVKKIENYKNNSLLVVRNNDKDYLIPYNFDIIKEIDLKKKQIYINDIEGLF